MYKIYNNVFLLYALVESNCRQPVGFQAMQINQVFGR